MTATDASLRDIVAARFGQADALRTGFTAARPLSHCLVDGFIAAPRPELLCLIELRAGMPGMVGSGRHAGDNARMNA